jgi:hypothetical protein
MNVIISLTMSEGNEKIKKEVSRCEYMKLFCG